MRQALQQAEAAYKEAQESLSDVTALPSAQLPYQVGFGLIRQACDSDLLLAITQQSFTLHPWWHYLLL